MKADQVIVTLVLVFFAGFFLYPLVFEVFIIRLSDLTASLAAIFSAFFGALCAFSLAQYKEEKKEIERRADLVNKAIFSIWHAKGGLESFYNKNLKPFEKSHLRHIQLHPYTGIKRFKINFDFMDLNFLLKHDSLDVLYKTCSLAEDIEAIVQLIDKRSEEFALGIQPKINEIEKKERRSLSLDEIAFCLNYDLMSIKDTTDRIYDVVPKYIDCIDNILSELHDLSLMDLSGKFIHDPRLSSRA